MTGLSSRKARVEDAMHATKAAVERHRGRRRVALLRTLDRLDKIKVDGDGAVGVRIIRSVLETPIRQIAENAGVEGSIVVSKTRDGKGNYGYNARTDKYEDLVAAGVIDPVKVTRTALQNAASVAALLLTTEAVIAEIPEKKEPVGMPGGGGGMDY